MLVAVLVTALAACGPAAIPSSPPVSTSAPGASTVPDGTLGSAPRTASPAGASAAASSAASPAAVDPSLISVLPATVDDREVVETPDAERASAADPSIAGAVEHLAVAYVASQSAADWAIASVVRLRPGTWSDAFYRDWRDTYDSGVCATHGGVGGHASATIGGREVEIATCGALRTYHVHLPGDVVVSVVSVGDRRYGEQLVAGLRP